MKKKKTIGKLRKQAVTLFNKYIRISKSYSSGWAKCITCGKMVYWNKCDAGHFKHGLDFIEDNQHPQCKGCNAWGHGELDLYTTFMIDTYGRDRVDELTRLKNNGQKFSRSELEEKISYYNMKIKEFE